MWWRRRGLYLDKDFNAFNAFNALAQFEQYGLQIQQFNLHDLDVKLNGSLKVQVYKLFLHGHGHK